MAKIDCIRHCPTDPHEGVDRDRVLSKSGKAKARAIGSRIIRENPEIWSVLISHSRVPRARETAEEIKNALPRGVGILDKIVSLEDDLDERYLHIIDRWREIEQSEGKDAGVEFFLGQSEALYTAQVFARKMMECLEVIDKVKNRVLHFVHVWHSGELEAFLLHVAGTEISADPIEEGAHFVEKIGGMLEGFSMKYESGVDFLEVQVRGKVYAVEKTVLETLAQGD